ncbi:MAG: serine/threonine transporter SstT [Streptococcaceae bacterium]|jgi:serine/threonine transporter|nr:serine/threonine transporter SstT [Streptococcaceae bacterium]
MHKVLGRLPKLSFIQQVLVGIIIGALFGVFLPHWTFLSILGDLFMGALKAIAPLLVFFLITASLSKHQKGKRTHIRSVIILYVIATFVAAFVAVLAVYAFPVTVSLGKAATGQNPPSDLVQILKTALMNAVANPIQALIDGNYLSILLWSCLLGSGMRAAGEATKKVLDDITNAISYLVEIIIKFIPVGIIGLVYSSVSSTGLKIFLDDGKLILLIVFTMLFVAYGVYPFMVWLILRQNPYPLTFYTMKESGVPAFFTRSSAVNVPINMEIARKLQLNEESYSISIPLGASVNSGGAAITVTIMTMVGANTLGMHVPFLLAFILSVVATIASTGVSGIVGGSLLIIPLACSFFGISNDIAMQIVAIGFTIGVIQDAVETAVNSAADLLFASTAEFYDLRKEGKVINVGERVRQAKLMD